MAFFPQLPWLLFPLRWRHATGWDLTLLVMLGARRKVVSEEWVIERSQKMLTGPG